MKKNRWVNPVKVDTIKVTVTSDDIKKGKPRNEDCCPIALATNRAFDGMLEGSLSVCQSFVALRVTGEPIERTEQLPGEAVAFIRDFDAGIEVKPFEFKLPVDRLKKKASNLLPENNFIKNEELPIDNITKN